MRRALALVLSLVLALAVLPFAASARTLTDGEKAIFAELRDPATAGDGKFVLPEKTIKQGENYLAALDTALTQDQINAIVGFVKDAKATVTAANTGDVGKWTQATRDHILKDIDDAAKVIGLRARGHSASEAAVGDEHGYGSIEIYDPDTDATVVAEDELVKRTGSDFASLAVVGLCGIAVLCACVFVSKKVELF